MELTLGTSAHPLLFLDKWFVQMYLNVKFIYKVRWNNAHIYICEPNSHKYDSIHATSSASPNTHELIRERYKQRIV